MSFRIPYLASQISATCRRGVSLLEVLFSIGIVAVGLLGIMVLLPVAGSRVAHGVVADMGDRVGRSAIRQFNVQLMRQPNVWAQYDSSTNLYQPFDRVKTVTDPSSSKTAKYPKSFCVDPLCVATLVASPSAYTAVAGYFPSIPQVSTADPRMDRISLRPAPGSGSGMTRAQAEQAFLYQDDLTVSLPDDRTLLPMQNFGTGSPGWRR
ncbi:MAG: hypothetical protein NTY19_42650 [Planctomycetota bacterium]|nr:hypothetical protein [Planctomycetota bacterium]